VANDLPGHDWTAPWFDAQIYRYNLRCGQGVVNR
jgi:hypothetical protein